MGMAIVSRFSGYLQGIQRMVLGTKYSTFGGVRRLEVMLGEG